MLPVEQKQYYDAKFTVCLPFRIKVSIKHSLLTELEQKMNVCTPRVTEAETHRHACRTHTHTDARCDLYAEKCSL